MKFSIIVGSWRHTKLSRPHHDSQLGVPIVLDDAAAMPHFRSRSYLCTQHDYPLSARRDTLHKLYDQSRFNLIMEQFITSYIVVRGYQRPLSVVHFCKTQEDYSNKFK